MSALYLCIILLTCLPEIQPSKTNGDIFEGEGILQILSVHVACYVLGHHIDGNNTLSGSITSLYIVTSSILRLRNITLFVPCTRLIFQTFAIATSTIMVSVLTPLLQT